jgi:hypothetical protein
MVSYLVNLHCEGTADIGSERCLLPVEQRAHESGRQGLEYCGNEGK